MWNVLIFASGSATGSVLAGEAWVAMQRIEFEALKVGLAAVKRREVFRRAAMAVEWRSEGGQCFEAFPC